MSSDTVPCAGCEQPIRLVEVLPGAHVWRHHYRDTDGQLRLYRWCRLREAAPRKRPRPFNGTCTVCGGNHWTDEHPA